MAHTHTKTSFTKHSTPSLDRITRWSVMVFFHCMVRHGSVRFTFGGFSSGYCTWYFFSTTSAEVPSEPYRYQNVTCKLYWSLIGRRESSLLVTELATRDPPLQPDPLDFNQHSQRRIERNFCLNKRTFLHQPQNSSVVVCWGRTDVPLVDSRGADPARAWWRDAEGKSLMYITLLLNLLYFQGMFSVYIFTFVLLQLKTIWLNKCTSRLY